MKQSSDIIAKCPLMPASERMLIPYNDGAKVELICLFNLQICFALHKCLSITIFAPFLAMLIELI